MNPVNSQPMLFRQKLKISVAVALAAHHCH